MDRLKPAFVDLEHPVELLEPRHCRWPLNKDHSGPTQPKHCSTSLSLCTRSGRLFNLPRLCTLVLRVCGCVWVCVGVV